VCLGTRPEGIKMAPVVKALEKDKKRFVYKICSSGQHREMLNQVFDFFEYRPHYDLKLMKKDQSLGEISSRLLGRLGKIFEIENPDIVLVQGDTSTAFLTGLFSFYCKVKVGHVEAGLRTDDKFNPFPEEINRQLLSRVTDLHFAPTDKAYQNLLRENISKDNIFLTGNTIVDAVEWGIKKIKSKESAKGKNELADLLDDDKKIVLVTMHRRESFGRDIEQVCKALREIAQSHKDFQIVYPVHLNPNVKGPVYKMLGDIDNIILIPPQDYSSFIWLMYRSYIIVTDSGGIQEEAPTLRKPVIVIRKATEREESVEMGISKLVGTDSTKIIKNISQLISDKKTYDGMISGKNPYGDGKAAEKILDAIYNNI
jgi:UDP-N-acetylglucosamine 2-epimerase (non-hydrolysing)